MDCSPLMFCIYFFGICVPYTWEGCHNLRSLARGRCGRCGMWDVIRWDTQKVCGGGQARPVNSLKDGEKDISREHRLFYLFIHSFFLSFPPLCQTLTMLTANCRQMPISKRAILNDSTPPEAYAFSVFVDTRRSIQLLFCFLPLFFSDLFNNNNNNNMGTRARVCGCKAGNWNYNSSLFSSVVVVVVWTQLNWIVACTSSRC